MNVWKRPKTNHHEFTQLLDGMLDGFLHGKIVLDDHAKPIDWIYLSINRAFELEVGLKKDEVLGKRVSEVLPLVIEDKADWVGRYGKVAMTGKPDSMVGYTAQLDAYYEVNIYSPRIGEFIAIFKNVTDKINAEEKLKDSDAGFRNIFEHATIGILVLDSDGVISMINSHAEKLFGYNNHELIGKKIEQLIPHHIRDNHESLRKSYFHHPSTKIMGEGLDLLAQRKDGSEFPVEISLSHYKADNQILAMAFVSDISSRKEAQRKERENLIHLEYKVQERTADLKRVNEELESFSYSVSHDLRAPLRAINGFAEALSQDYGDQLDDEANRFLGRISANSLKMGQLIDDLLEFSRMNRKKTKFQQVNLEVIISKIIKELFPESSKFINLGKLPTIIGDSEMLEQVFINLISNAIKYSSKEKRQKIEISSKENAGEFIISIQDNGVGFDEQYENKLFKVFQRLHGDADFEGTGVGLALCNKIIKVHHGEIWAESVINEGSIFHVKFKKNRELDA